MLECLNSCNVLCRCNWDVGIIFGITSDKNILKLSYLVCFRNSDSGSVDRVPCHGTIAMSGEIIFPFSTFSLNIFELIYFGASKTYRV